MPASWSKYALPVNLSLAECPGERARRAGPDARAETRRPRRPTEGTLADQAASTAAAYTARDQLDPLKPGARRGGAPRTRGGGRYAHITEQRESGHMPARAGPSGQVRARGFARSRDASRSPAECGVRKTASFPFRATT